MRRTPMKAKLFIVLVLVVLSGCAVTPFTPVTPVTHVILLPDEKGHVGAVLVSNDKGLEKIDEAYAAVTIKAKDAAPSEPSAIGRETVERRYSELLRAQPTPPKAFTLNFLLDSTELTAASKAMLPELLLAVRERKPTEVTVVGHADASGWEHRNLILSAERAKVVADLLKQVEPGVPVASKHFGDRQPLVPNPPGKPEPRNRRAEIEIL